MSLLKSLFRKRRKLDPNVLIYWSDRDPYTINDAMEGIAILGGTGAAKTTSSGFQLSLAMIERGFGGLVLTAKTDEADRWRRLCSQAGRHEDLIIFDDSSGHCFNFLSYLATRQSPESGLTENLVNLLEEMVEVSNRINNLKAAKGDELYWTNGRRELARNAIDLILLATGTVSAGNLVEVVRDAPRSRAQAQDVSFYEENLVGMLLKQAMQRPLSKEALHDLEQVEHFFTKSYATLSEKTRSCFEAGLMGVLDLFGRGKLHQLFGKGSTVTPDDILQGKIIVIDLPIKKYGGIGVIAQSIWKAMMQQRVEQRSAGEDRPCFLYIDEAQNFLTIRDMHFSATARSSFCVNIWLTQNISNVYVALGGDESGKAATDSLLGMAQTKIIHQNSDPVTNNWAAELIGRRKVRMRGASITPQMQPGLGFFMDDRQVTTSFSESYEFAVQPSTFTTLRKGGRPHGYAEAIVFQGGRRWHKTRDSYIRVAIKQGY